MNFLSVIIPVRNCEKYIGQALNTFLDINDPIEILIADGGSTDLTLSIINNYAERGLRINIISYLDDGQSNALNKLLKEIKTEFFIWLDADDVISPDFIYQALAEIRKAKEKDRRPIISITANSIIIDERGKFLKYQIGLRDQDFLIKNGVWFGKFPCRIWNTQLSRNVGNFDENLYYCMDYDFLRRQYFDNRTVQTIHLNKTLGAFRHHVNSKTGNDINTPFVKAEVNTVLNHTKLQQILFKSLSIIVRVMNLKYLFFRLFGRLNFVNKHGIMLAAELQQNR